MELPAPSTTNQGHSGELFAAVSPTRPAPPNLPPLRVSQRVRRVLVAACLIALVPALVSYVATMLEPSNSSLGIRSVEWLRDHGAAGLVTKVESIYYTLEAPAKGGPALRALPKVGLATGSGVAGGIAGTRGARSAIPTVDRPPRVAPLSHPALPGEGVWHSTQVGESSGDPPLLVSTFRSDPAEYPRLVAGVAWINTSRTTISLYAGREEPSVELPSRGPMEVPERYRHKLLATFNSGFKLVDANGGWALDGHTYAPMRANQATFVRYRNGRYDVIAWRGGADVPANVVFARQNLPLIVSGGRPNPNLNNGPEWGATLGNAVQVWRSGIGIDRHGNLIYAAADDQTVGSLAQILIHAGAVRAMELDINSYWVSFNTYAEPGARQPSKLLGGMERPAERYLSPDDRDFFAVYLR
jgi:hypothetical protein